MSYTGLLSLSIQQLIQLFHCGSIFYCYCSCFCSIFDFYRKGTKMWRVSQNYELLLVLGSVQHYQSYLQCFFLKLDFPLLETHVYLFQFKKKKIDANGRISQWEMFCKNMFFFAMSPCCGHWLTCFARKGCSHLRLLFSQIILPEIRTEGIRSPRNSAVLV